MNLKMISQISLLKTFRFNYHYFKLAGIYVQVDRNVKLVKLKGKINVEKKGNGSITLRFGESSRKTVLG